MRKGTLLSGSMHGAFLVAVVFGTDWFQADDPVPLQLTEVSLVDGTEFDAALSTAPIVQSEGPADLTEPGDGQSAPDPVETPQDSVDAAVAPDLVVPSATPEPRPDLPEIALPPPPRAIPTEAPAPSIAEIPSPDVLPDQASEPESPAATEPVQPLASQAAPSPSARPSPPPPPEPEPSEVVEETPEEQEPTETVEEQINAPLGDAPREAKLPIAKPADKAKAAIAAAEAAQKARDKELAEKKPTPAETASTPEPQPAKPAKPAGGSKSVFAARVSRGEQNALRLGIKRHFVYNGANTRGLSVKIAVNMDKSGKIVGKPKLLRANGGDASAQRALFSAGSRALRKAEAAGEFRKLPVDKFASWQLIHVTFTPEAIGFAS